MVRMAAPPEIVSPIEEVVGRIPEEGLWVKGSVAVTDAGLTFLGEFAKLLVRVVDYAFPAAILNTLREE